MGQKINPIGIRLGINRTWDSRWFAGRDYAKVLHQDLKLRDYLMTRLLQAGRRSRRDRAYGEEGAGSPFTRLVRAW